MSSIRQPNVIFFFGAGASIKANVPGTFRFVDEFIKHIKEMGLEKEAHCLDETIEIIRERNRKIKHNEQVDIEELLASLVKLSERNEDYLAAFYDDSGFRLKSDIQTIQSLATKLKTFIRRRVIVEEEDVEYLSELLKFDSPLVIFSVNYDTCIEQLCHTHRVRYSDGFTLYWDHEDFIRPEIQVRHYKIHGSAIWYETDKKEYIKIPLEFEKKGELESFTLITGEKTSPLITYPLQKWEYIEPLTELQLMFKKQLVCKETRFVVMVGYSFRDEYILKMLWDSANKNDELIFLFIDPNSPALYNEKLAYYDLEKGIQSILRNKVILMPYPFENILPLLKNSFINVLKSVREQERGYLEQERTTGNANWSECIAKYIQCGFNSKYEEILEKYGWEKIDVDQNYFIRRFDLAFTALLNSLCIEDKKEKLWLDRLNCAFKSFSTNNLSLGFSGEGFDVFFNIDEWHQRFRLHNIHRDVINRILSRFEERKRILRKDFFYRINCIENSLIKLKTFRDLIIFYTDRISWETFIKKIGSSNPQLASLIQKYLNTINGKIGSTDEQRDKLRKEVNEKVEATVKEEFKNVFANGSPTFSIYK